MVSSENEGKKIRNGERGGERENERRKTMRDSRSFGGTPTPLFRVESEGSGIGVSERGNFQTTLPSRKASALVCGYGLFDVVIKVSVLDALSTPTHRYSILPETKGWGAIESSATTDRPPRTSRPFQSGLTLIAVLRVLRLSVDDRKHPRIPPETVGVPTVTSTVGSNGNGRGRRPETGGVVGST